MTERALTEESENDTRSGHSKRCFQNKKAKQVENILNHL
jgi:hypothetical protein